MVLCAHELNVKAKSQTRKHVVEHIQKKLLHTYVYKIDMKASNVCMYMYIYIYVYK